MEKTALLSGLIGALVSAALSYWIRAALDKRALRHAESRIAYVHLVQVSQLVAMRNVLMEFLKIFAGDRAKDSLISKEGAFEPSHKVSALLAQQLQKITQAEWKNTPGFSTVPVYLKSQLDSIKESKLSAEQLSKLPKDTVLIYSEFLSYLSHIEGIINLYILHFEEDKSPTLSAEDIHDQWLTISRFFSHAEKLRLALVKSGAATLKEAVALLLSQTIRYRGHSIEKLQAKPKVAAAEAEVNEATKG